MQSIKKQQNNRGCKRETLKNKKNSVKRCPAQGKKKLNR